MLPSSTLSTSHTEAADLAKEYPAWPLQGVSPPASQCEEGVRARSAAGQQRVRWADETPLDTVAAEQVARALAANCAKLEMSIAKLTRESQRFPSSVQPEEEQLRVQDEQACLEQ